jgi:hypothetical protein
MKLEGLKAAGQPLSCRVVCDWIKFKNPQSPAMNRAKDMF